MKKLNKRDIAIIAIIFVLVISFVLFQKSFALDEKEFGTNEKVDEKYIVISYLSDGDGALTANSEVVKYGESPNFPDAVPNPDYKFIGFTSDINLQLKDGSTVQPGDLISKENAKSIICQKDFTLVANFEGTNKKYSLVYKDGNTILSTIKVDKDEYVNLDSPKEKLGYTFLGWNIDGKNYDVYSRYKVTKNTIVNAVYYKLKPQSHTLTYKSKDKIITSEEVKDNNEIMLKSLNINGCNEGEWLINGEKYHAGDAIEVLDNITVIANSCNK